MLIIRYTPDYKRRIVTDSKKTKNTTTPKSVVTLNSRVVALLFTEKARTWTQILSVMDCAMESSSETNSSRPRCEPSGLLRIVTANASASASSISRDNASFLARSYRVCADDSDISLIQRPTRDRNDVTPTTIVTRIAASSSSPICASRAAWMNSDATEKLIDTDRSAPMLDSVLPAAEAMASPKDYTILVDTIGGMLASSSSSVPTSSLRAPLIDTNGSNSNPIARPRSYNVSVETISRACVLKTMLFDRPLISRQTSGAYVVCASCFLATEAHVEPKRPAGISKRCKPRASHHQTACANGLATCSGSVYGCTLSSLVRYCVLRGAPVAQVVRCIQSVLTPVAQALKYVDGFDLHTLCAGIASRRMLRLQVGRIGALSHSDVDGASSITASGSSSSRRGLHTRLGNPHTIIGAAAAILCVYRVLSVPMLGGVLLSELISEAEFLCTTDSLERAITCLLGEGGVLDQGISNMGVGEMPEWERSAMEVERRALARALAAVRAAARFAHLSSLNHRQTMDTALSWYAKAAWPAGEVVNERTQTSLMERVGRPLYYTSPVPLSDLAVARTVTPSIVPLSELGCVSGRGSIEGDDDSSCATFSSQSRSNPSSGSASVVCSSGGGRVDLSLSGVQL